MRIILDGSQTCIEVDNKFVAACNVSSSLSAKLASVGMSAIASVLRAWDMHVHDLWVNYPEFAWWEAAATATLCDNTQLLRALCEYVARLHLNPQYNVRIVMTRMQYLLDGKASYARHQPKLFATTDHLTPILCNPALADFGKMVATKYVRMLELTGNSGTELRRLAARVDANTGVEQVTLTCCATEYTCIPPPHPDWENMARLLAEPVDVVATTPGWFQRQTNTASDELDAYEDTLDRALGVQMNLHTQANQIIEGLGAFTAIAAEPKNTIVGLITAQVNAQDTTVQKLTRAVEDQQTIVDCLQDISDWYTRETDEIREYHNWHIACIELEELTHDQRCPPTRTPTPPDDA